MAVPWALLAATAAPSLISAFGKKQSANQVPMETPEQTAARNQLWNFAQTGQWGDFKAGAEVPLGYGDFNATGLEQAGQSKLAGLMGSIPEQYRLGDDALRDFLSTDPRNVSAMFDPFSQQVDRQTAESERALKRSAGFAGGLYSTDTIRRLGDLQARAGETKTMELARLTDSALNRRLSAVPLAYQSAESQDQAQMQRVAASQQYGSLTRQLNDASIKARDAELMRRRQELQLPLQAAQAVMGSTPNYGVPGVQVSPYQDLLNMVGQVGGQYLGNELYMDQYKRKFPGQQPQAQPRPIPPRSYGAPGYGV